MIRQIKTENDKAWEALFNKYNILSSIETYGRVVVSASQMREYREPRLMAKFDHSINLPQIFAQNHLSILPVSRGKYVISRFNAYQRFESLDRTVIRAYLPSNIQSLDANEISSEAIAINCAWASGILEDFLEEDLLYATVSGRMGSGNFNFNILDTGTNELSLVNVEDSQIEIDAAFEGVNCLALIEAKRDIADDFLIRQLYYPYRVWSSRVTKKVRPIFLVYSNGVFSLYEYKFQEQNTYNSLKLIRHKNYTIEDISIKLSDLQEIFLNTDIISEPQVAFPQADNFERVINICELLNVQELSRNQITEEYDFDGRQTNYYTDAARYLGLLYRKYEDGRKPVYSLTTFGKYVMNLKYKQRQLLLCKTILQHGVFKTTFELWTRKGAMPDTDTIVKIMHKFNLYKIGSPSTYARRSSTVSGWINWMFGLINDV